MPTPENMGANIAAETAANQALPIGEEMAHVEEQAVVAGKELTNDLSAATTAESPAELTPAVDEATAAAEAAWQRVDALQPLDAHASNKPDAAGTPTTTMTRITAAGPPVTSTVPKQASPAPTSRPNIVLPPDAHF
jgi:hypothetical protein